jgi:hypothetical protein
MATATASAHKPRRESNLGRPLHGAPAGAAERPAPRHPGDEAPWSDEERKAAGLPPIGEGSGAPGSARARRNIERRQRAEVEANELAEREAKTKADRAAKAATERHAQRSRKIRSEGREVTRAARKTASTATGGLSAMLSGKSPGTLGGLFFGMILYAMGKALLDGGPAEVAGWLGAKFINRPYTKSSGEKAASPAAPATPQNEISVPASPGSPASVLVA